MLGKELVISKVVNRAEETWSVEEATGARLPSGEDDAIAKCRAALIDHGCVPESMFQGGDWSAQIVRRNAFGLRDFYLEFEAPWPVPDGSRLYVAGAESSQLRDAEARAWQLAQSGSLDLAIQVQETIVQHLLAVQGPSHRATMMAANNHAGMMQKKGEHGGAAKLLATLVAEAEKYLGEFHGDTLLFMNNLAEALRRLGRAKEALELHVVILNRAVMVYGLNATITTQAAWQVFKTSLGWDGQTAANVLHTHLDWLTDAPTESLSSIQVAIRDELTRLRSK